MSMYTQPAVQTFATREQAQAEVAKMRGWDTRIVENQPLDFLPVDSDNQVSYSIQCDGNKFLYEDGFVK